jgi:mRNA-degrading endonuclease YafQ of YafQ-DinJ toxin-antitoxin module
MKRITTTKLFDKNFIRAIRSNTKLRLKFYSRVNLFQQHRSHHLLHDHKLKGKLNAYHAFSITGDVRVIYEEHSDHYRFVDIGTHAQVYGD